MHSREQKLAEVNERLSQTSAEHFFFEYGFDSSLIIKSFEPVRELACVKI